MTPEDHIIQAVRSEAHEAEINTPPTDVAWRHIQDRAARRRRQRGVRRIVAILTPLVAAGGIAAGAVESYAPASHPRAVIVNPQPSSTQQTTTTAPVATPTTVGPVPTTTPRSRSSATTPAPATRKTVAVGPTRVATPTTVTAAPTTVVATPTTVVATPTTVEGLPLSSVQWASISYPFSCGSTLQGPVGYRVVQVAYPDPAPNQTVAIVMVECNSGAGTPPIDLLVYDHATSTHAPHLAQTLIDMSAQYQASGFSATGNTVTVAVAGFSSPNVPNCCPDIHRTLTWRWSGGSYQPGP
jgi:hypothetical protein